MKKHKLLIIFLLGYLFGCLAMFPEQQYLKKEIKQWSQQWEDTRDAWLQDRRDWRDGKPFKVRYSQRHQSW